VPYLVLAHVPGSSPYSLPAPRRIRLFTFYRIPRLRFRSAGPMALLLLAHARTCATRLLDSRAHTAHTQPTVSVGPVQTALGSPHGCNPSAACPSDRCTLHPCVVAACHLIHTRPPDIHVACLAYQRSLSNTYFFLGLRRPRSRNSNDRSSSRAFVTTRSGAGSDLPGGRRTMTGSDDDAPAARGPPLGSRARRSEASESSRAWRPADFPPQSSFTGCTVRCREDVPRHIYGLFQALGIQYRWVLTRGTLGRELLKADDLAIDDAKVESWMAVYEHERDLLGFDRRCARRKRWDHPYPAYSEIFSSGYKRCCDRPSSRALEEQSWCDDRQGDRIQHSCA
jgi:hypothetical protein